MFSSSQVAQTAHQSTEVWAFLGSFLRIKKRGNTRRMKPSNMEFEH
jgi:hypothetical protein